jgi:hypothetical protein
MTSAEQELLFEILIRHRGILEGQLKGCGEKLYQKTLDEIDLTNKTLNSVTKITRTDLQ